MLQTLRVVVSHQSALRYAKSISGRRQFNTTAFLGLAAAASGGKQLVHELDDSTFPKFLADSKVPVIADFYADWCGPCRMITPLLTKAIEAEQGRVVLVKINVDECNKVAGTYGISALPTVVAFKNGKEKSRFIGLKNETQIREFLKTVE